VAKAAPAKPEPAVAAAPAKEKPATQVADAKTKPVATEEKAKPVAKQTPAPTEKTPAVAPAAKPTTQQYTVKAGDTLSKLAEQFYSSSNKWERIYEANRDTLKNPNYIFIGAKLVIPADG
jgi:nucleoid-associated protein YgaU